MRNKIINHRLVWGSLFICILILFLACGGRKPEIADSDKLGDQNSEFDELFNVNKDDAKKTEDDEADVLKLLGITPQETKKTEPVEEKKVEEDKDENEELIKNLEAEIDEKSQEVKKLTGELDDERKKVYDLQAQLDAERSKAATYQKLGPASSSYKDRYDDALSEYNARNYRTAINKFEQLLATDSNNSLADNCQYWIGECYYALGDYTKAITAFEKVFSFNNSNKSDDSQLKLGLCYWRLNEVSRAREEFERLISHYPNSEYISIAEKYLNKL